MCLQNIQRYLFSTVVFTIENDLVNLKTVKRHKLVGIYLKICFIYRNITTCNFLIF